MSLFPGRHRFQVGPSTFTLQQDASGWWVHEVWWQIDRHGDKDDTFHDYGPYPTEAEAQSNLVCLKAERERRA